MSRKHTHVRMLLCRVRGNESEWRLTIEDVPSGIQVAELHISDAAFCDLMSSSNTRDGVVRASLNFSDLVGKQQECKRVHVPVPAGRARSAADTRLTLGAIFDGAEADNPGWTADRDREWNMHRTASGQGYEVTLRRWVTPENP